MSWCVCVCDTAAQNCCRNLLLIGVSALQISTHGNNHVSVIQKSVIMVLSEITVLAIVMVVVVMVGL